MLCESICYMSYTFLSVTLIWSCKRLQIKIQCSSKTCINACDLTTFLGIMTFLKGMKMLLLGSATIQIHLITYEIHDMQRNHPIICTSILHSTSCHPKPNTTCPQAFSIVCIRSVGTKLSQVHVLAWKHIWVSYDPSLHTHVCVHLIAL